MMEQSEHAINRLLRKIDDKLVPALEADERVLLLAILKVARDIVKVGEPPDELTSGTFSDQFAASFTPSKADMVLTYSQVPLHSSVNTESIGQHDVQSLGVAFPAGISKGSTASDSEDDDNNEDEDRSSDS